MVAPIFDAFAGIPAQWPLTFISILGSRGNHMVSHPFPERLGRAPSAARIALTLELLRDA